MTKPHMPAELDQPGRGRRGRGRRLHAQPVRRTPHQQWVADRFGRCDQQKLPRRRRERHQLPLEAFLDPTRHGRDAGQSDPARQLLGCQSARQLPQRQRVAPGLDHDTIAHLLIQRTDDDRLQQGLRISVWQSGNDEFRQPG